MSAQSDIAELGFWSLFSNPLQMWTRIWHETEEKKKKALCGQFTTEAKESVKVSDGV